MLMQSAKMPSSGRVQPKSTKSLIDVLNFTKALLVLSLKHVLKTFASPWPSHSHNWVMLITQVIAG